MIHFMVTAVCTQRDHKRPFSQNENGFLIVLQVKDEFNIEILHEYIVINRLERHSP